MANNYLNRIRARLGRKLQQNGEDLAEVSTVNFDSSFVIEEDLQNNKLNISLDPSTIISGTNLGTGALFYSGTNDQGRSTYYTVSGSGVVSVTNVGDTIVVSGSTNQPTNTYFFFHGSQDGTTTQPRNLWPGFSVTQWSNAYGWVASYIAPEDGYLTGITVHHSGNATGGTNIITYSVWKSTTTVDNFGATTLSASQQANVIASTSSLGSVAITKGDLFGVRATYNGTVTSTGNDALMMANVTFVKA